MWGPAIHGCRFVTNDWFAGVNPTNWNATGRTSSTNENMPFLKERGRRRGPIPDVSQRLRLQLSWIVTALSRAQPHGASNYMMAG